MQLDRGWSNDGTSSLFSPQITGTGHGIGRELALQYCAYGATVVGVDINEEGNAETLKQVKDRGYKSFTNFT